MRVVRDANQLFFFSGWDTAPFDGSFTQLHLTNIVLFEVSASGECSFGRPAMFATRAGWPRTVAIAISILGERWASTEEHRANKEE